ALQAKWGDVARTAVSTRSTIVQKVTETGSNLYERLGDSKDKLVGASDKGKGKATTTTTATTDEQDPSTIALPLNDDGLSTPAAGPLLEEDAELTQLLDRLSLAAGGGKLFGPSTSSSSSSPSSNPIKPLLTK